MNTVNWIEVAWVATICGGIVLVSFLLGIAFNVFGSKKEDN